MGGERPEWLPAGWKVSVKVRSTGKKDKYYVNSSKGLKFNSKPEVLRYLKSSSKDRKPKEVTKRNIEQTIAKQLPPGWIKEVRTTKKGNKTRRDPYYIDPVSGRHFRSMQEVFRYLESKDSREHAKSNPGDKDYVSMEMGDHSKSSSGEAKGQRLTDKKANKSFDGKQSVKPGSRRAVDLKDDSKENVRVPVEQGEEYDTPDDEPSGKLKLVNRVDKHADGMTNNKKLAEKRVDKSANGDQRSKSGSKVKKINISNQEHGDNQCDSVGGDLPNKLPQIDTKEQVKGGRRRSMRLADSKQKDNVAQDQSFRSGSGGACEKTIIAPENNLLKEKEKESNSTSKGQQQHGNILCYKRKTPNSKLASDLPCKKSKKLACEAIYLLSPSHEIKTSNQSRAPEAPPPAGESKLNTAKNIISRSGYLDEPHIDATAPKTSNEHNHSECGTENSTKNEEKPVISHDRMEEEDEKAGQKSEKNPNSSLDDLLRDPCIEFAVKTLTGAIPIDGANKVGESPVSSLSSPNGTSTLSSNKSAPRNIWADPCFEFAVKMLTGEVPVEDDGSRFCITIQQPVGPSLDSVCPLNSVSRFDGVKKTCVRQQGVKDASIACAINGGSSHDSVGAAAIE